MTPWDQLLLVNPQQPCRPEAEHVPHAFGAPPARHCKGLPQRGENVLMACNSPQAMAMGLSKVPGVPEQVTLKLKELVAPS